MTPFGRGGWPTNDASCHGDFYEVGEQPTTTRAKRHRDALRRSSSAAAAFAPTQRHRAPHSPRVPAPFRKQTSGLFQDPTFLHGLPGSNTGTVTFKYDVSRIISIWNKLSRKRMSKDQVPISFPLTVRPKKIFFPFCQGCIRTMLTAFDRALANMMHWWKVFSACSPARNLVVTSCIILSSLYSLAITLHHFVMISLRK